MMVSTRLCDPAGTPREQMRRVEGRLAASCLGAALGVSRWRSGGLAKRACADTSAS